MEGLTGRVAVIAGRIGAQVHQSVLIIAAVVFASMACVTKMSQHTPGPWKAQLLLPDGVVINRRAWEISTPNYDVCANIQNSAPIRNEADARLIAQAPRMFEFIQKCAYTSWKPEGIGMIMELASQIIAEIEGKEKPSRCYLCGNNTVINYECQECGARIKKQV